MNLFNPIQYTFLTFFCFSHCRNSFQSLIKNFLFYKSPFIMYTLSDITIIKYIQARTVLPDLSNEHRVGQQWYINIKKFWAYELFMNPNCLYYHIYSSINFLLLLSRYKYLKLKICQSHLLSNWKLLRGPHRKNFDFL